MPTYQTKKLLKTLSGQNNRFLTTTQQWSNLDESILQTPPFTESWSALQCIEHLNSYGLYYLPALRNALEKNQSLHFCETFSSGWLGNYFTNSMKPLKNGGLKKMKAPKGHVPVEDLQSKTVLEEFKQQCLTMNDLLSIAETTHLEKARVPISIMPFLKLKAGDVLMFVLAHNERHIRQAERAIQTNRSERLVHQKVNEGVLS